MQLPALEGDALPSEFRIFKAGINESSKGPALFDAEAAKLVMDRYTREGVDCMIDLSHDSFEQLAVRPDMGDARGWFKLALRDGELWAVDVTWTPDGARRLREKTQRYISPAFDMNEETKRVTGLWNVALVAMPATYAAEPLVAASRQTRDHRRLLSASFNEVQAAVAGALRTLYPDSVTGACRAWVSDLYDDRVVFELDGVLYSSGYTYARGAATIAPNPVRVERTYLQVASRQTRDGMAYASEEDFMRALSEVVGLAHYPWDQCISDQLSAGHDQKIAENICGAIKAQNQGRVLTKLAEVLASKPSAEVGATLSRITGASLAQVFAAATLRFVARATQDKSMKQRAYKLLSKAKAMK